MQVQHLLIFQCPVDLFNSTLMLSENVSVHPQIHEIARYCHLKQNIEEWNMQLVLGTGICGCKILF